MDAMTEHLVSLVGLLCLVGSIPVFAVAAIKRNKRLIAVGIALLAVFATETVREHYSDFWREDSCMDSGGRYNHEEEKCEY
jgi:hypothetical protein